MKRYGLVVLLAVMAFGFAGVSTASADDCASDLADASILAAQTGGCWANYGICKVNPSTSHAECMRDKAKCEAMDEEIAAVHARCKT